MARPNYSMVATRVPPCPFSSQTLEQTPENWNKRKSSQKPLIIRVAKRTAIAKVQAIANQHAIAKVQATATSGND